MSVGKSNSHATPKLNCNYICNLTATPNTELQLQLQLQPERAANAKQRVAHGSRG
jgi:hypothetical protein